MLLKFGSSFIIFLILLVPEFLANPDKNNNFTRCSTRQKNKTVEISSEDLKIRISEIQSGIPNPMVRDDYTHTPGIGWHKFHTLAKTWNEARKICIEEDAHLAIINLKQEAEVLHNVFKQKFTSIKNSTYPDYAWLGTHDLFSDNDWVTVLGDPIRSVGILEWNTECGSLSTPQGGKHCLTMGHLCGTMYDGTCGNNYAFFCEKPEMCL